MGVVGGDDGDGGEERLGSGSSGSASGSRGRRAAWLLLTVLGGVEVKAWAPGRCRQPKGTGERVSAATPWQHQELGGKQRQRENGGARKRGGS